MDERPWMDATLSPDARAARLEAEMTDDERYQLLHSRWAAGLLPGSTVPEGAVPGAGYVPPIPRLGVPGLYETDASLGVTNPRNCRPGDSATALPSGLSLAASWDEGLAYDAGRMIGDEAAKKGFNVLLGGGVNLVREPRNGRNFEYMGEDPLLSGRLAGAAVAGIQANGIVATLKHFVLNDQETGRHVLNARIGEAALRESDLLAFQIAIERGQPGAIMTAYNRINGDYACEHGPLLGGVLKGDWGYPGWVMSDWGATSGVAAAAAGLDQQSGEELDYRVWFDGPLRDAVERGEVPQARVADMARRILRSMFAAGLFDHPLPVGEAIDTAAHNAVAQRAAEAGIVLLKNEGGLLPIREGTGVILVVGGHADVGVVCGGGSSQVTTGAGHAAAIHVGGDGAMMAMATEAYHPSSPLKAIRALARESGAQVRFANGRYPSEAAALARAADLAIVFATQWTTEGSDVPDLSLPLGQDALIAAVAAANPNTVVVLETGGPVLMPWLAQTPAVVEAWYPGGRGGEAIAAVLFGRVNPAGRLPVTFPRSVDQLPRPELPGAGGRWKGPAGPAIDVTQAPSFDADHAEGSDVGYRWFAQAGEAPLFPFGFGLSYTTFRYANLTLEGGAGLRAAFEVTNTGTRDGIDTPQLYLQARNGAPKVRLLGWARVALQPGETRRVEIEVDLRLLADFDVGARRWRVPAGDYAVFVGASATQPELAGAAQMTGADLSP